MGNTPVLPADGGRSVFTDVRSLLRGDVVLGNMDSTLTDRSGPSKCGATSTNCFAFRAPPSFAGPLHDAGFTVINLANNHSHDYGGPGLLDTREALTAHHVAYDGMPGQVTVLRAGGLRVAVVGFAPYGWAQSLIDIPAAQALVRSARRQADLVLVTMHAGGEGEDETHVRPGTEFFLGENRGNSIAFTHAVIDAGAAVVFGSGPHVLRGMEWYRGRLIAYSLGNFVGYRTLSASGRKGVGAVLSVRLRRDGTFVSGRLTGTRMTGVGLPVTDPRQTGVTYIGQLSQEDFPRCGARLTDPGTLAAPTC